jgi:8-oxo-dGTP pyrophosphatase MutT (NUDIX family)
VALPGGRRDPEDADLLDTARRETLEETGLRLEREDHLGRLGEIHPRSKYLPSICVTPFVAWMPSHQEVRVNHELSGHLWVPLSALSDPGYRSTLVREAPTVREFPAIDYQGDVIWGLTFAILEDFLAALGAGVPRQGP